MTDTATNTPAQSSPFWRFSLRFYREPAVAEACIRLQEEAGVDVNLLMYLFWHATRRRSFNLDEVTWFESKVGPWRDAIVVPLRGVRRALKTPVLVEGARAEPFRTRIKAVELEAERLQQEAMYEFSSAAPAGEEVASATDAARASLTAYAAMLETEFPPEAVDTLLVSFDKLTQESDHGQGHL